MGGEKGLRGRMAQAKQPEHKQLQKPSPPCGYSPALRGKWRSQRGAVSGRKGGPLAVEEGCEGERLKQNNQNTSQTPHRISHTAPHKLVPKTNFRGTVFQIHLWYNIYGQENEKSLPHRVGEGDRLRWRRAARGNRPKSN